MLHKKKVQHSRAQRDQLLLSFLIFGLNLNFRFIQFDFRMRSNETTFLNGRRCTTPTGLYCKLNQGENENEGKQRATSNQIKEANDKIVPE